MVIRVIGGQAKKRKLFGPSGEKFRPATGIVKEFIFSYLQLYIKNASVLDLFAGSGSLGIEALSRGASRVYFIDRSTYSIDIIKKNLQLCKYSRKGCVIKGNVFTELPRMGNKQYNFDLILADPPYQENLREKTVSFIDKYDLLNSNGLLIVKHKKGDADTNKHDIILVKQKKFGINEISIYCNPKNK